MFWNLCQVENGKITDIFNEFRKLGLENFRHNIFIVIVNRNIYREKEAYFTYIDSIEAKFDSVSGYATN